jgi:hypothetical protein
MMKCRYPFQLPYKGLHDSATGPEQAILSGFLRLHAGIQHDSPILMNPTGLIELLSGPLYPWDDPCIRPKAMLHAPIRRISVSPEVLP